MQRSLNIAVLTALLLCVPQVYAQQRSRSEAQQIAESHFLRRAARMRASEKACPTPAMAVSEHEAYYLFTRQTQGGTALPGYVLVSADKRMPAVLAYSDEGFFASGSGLPPHVRQWLGGYGQMQETCAAAPHDVQAWLAASVASVGEVSPLLQQTAWGQEEPYNLHCPVVDDEHTPSGCVATALAQIMRYYRWPKKGTGKKQYRTSTRNIPISVNFSSTTFDWNHTYDYYGPSEITDNDSEESLTDDGRFTVKGLTVDNYQLQCHIQIERLTILGSSFFEGNAALLLLDDAGNHVQRVSLRKKLDKHSAQLFNNEKLLLAIPSGLADGKYQVWLAAQYAGSKEWHLAKDISQATEDHLTIEKTGRSFTIDGNDYPCSLTQEQAEPVANVLAAVGAAVEMDYDTGGSGASSGTALQGMKSYLGYDADMYLASPNAYTDEQWHQLLQKELAEGRPVYYTGRGENAEAGHAFVIDGVRPDKSGVAYYHVNWGWDGLCNGYYLLDMLRPVAAGTGGTAGSNYSNNAAMIVGIMPEDGKTTTYMVCKNLDIGNHELFAGQALSICLEKLSLRSGTDYTGDLRVELQRKGAVKDAPLVIYRENQRTITLERGLTNYYMPCTVPLGVASGDYNVVLACTQGDGTEVLIDTDHWAELHVLADEEWTGGASTQPSQYVAMTGLSTDDSQAREGRFAVTVGTLVNVSPATTTGKLAFLLCDEAGKMLAPLNERHSVVMAASAQKKNYVVDTYLPKGIPDGNYLLVLGYLPTEASLWSICPLMVSRGNILWSTYESFSWPVTVRQDVVTIGGVDYAASDAVPGLPELSRIGTVTADDMPEAVYQLNGGKAGNRHRGVYIEKSKRGTRKILY